MKNTLKNTFTLNEHKGMIQSCYMKNGDLHFNVGIETKGETGYQKGYYSYDDNEFHLDDARLQADIRTRALILWHSTFILVRLEELVS